MPIRVRQRNEDMIVIRTKNALETSFILNQIAKLKWVPEPMRPEISVKDIHGKELDIPKPEMKKTVSASGNPMNGQIIQGQNMAVMTEKIEPVKMEGN